MRAARLRRAWLAALWLVTAPAAGEARDAEPLKVLAVPFVAQTEQLCGGAAAAMVLGYWSGTTVDASEFAPLVDQAAGGIRADVLTAAIRDRDWFAQPLRGTPALVKAHLARGRPLIVLIEERPGRYHYVVLVAWHAETILAHDPARGPFREFTTAAFQRAWAASGFWTLLIQPGADQHRSTETASIDASEPETGGCHTAVSQAIVLARAGDPEGADALLQEAGQRCPDSPAVNRERAGLRFLESEWHEAARFAERAVRQSPTDAHAWRLLAASRFMQDNPQGALDAWNAVGEPRIDRVRFDVRGSVPAVTVKELLQLEAGDLLTGKAVRRARRRLSSLPAASGGVGYVPGSAGQADVTVSVTERPGPLSFGNLVVGLTRAVAEQELQVDVPVPSAHAALASFNWRWSDARPRVALALQVPKAFGRVGLWRVEALWESLAYPSVEADGDGLSRDPRRRLALDFGDWYQGDTWVSAGIALERWQVAGPYVTLALSLDRRLVDDHVSLQANGALSPALARAGWFGRYGASLAWRSSAFGHTPTLSARGGLEAATRDAPVSLWPTAGTSRDSAALARAHPTQLDGVHEADRFGRRLAHARVEIEIPVASASATRVSLAAFTDAVRAWDLLDPARTSRAQMDVGMGVLVRIAGIGPALRIDAAHGFLDGERALSVRWQLPWPGVDH